MATGTEVISHQLLNENIGPIVILFVGALLTALGWFVRNWVKKIEKEITEKVHKEVCEEREAQLLQRRITDSKQLVAFGETLTRLEDKVSEHIQWHLEEKGN